MSYVRRLCIILLLGMCVSACSTATEPVPLVNLQAQPAGGTWRTAAVIVAQDAQWYLVPYVIITPENAPQLATPQIPITLDTNQATQIPWRDDHGIRYAPALITGTIDTPLRFVRMSAIDTTLGEASVATIPRDQLVRVIGLLNTHPDGTHIHDQANAAQHLAFRPAWVTGATPIRLAEGAPVMIEGVRVSNTLIPLVIAPVVTR